MESEISYLCADPVSTWWDSRSSSSNSDCNTINNNYICHSFLVPRLFALLEIMIHMNGGNVSLFEMNVTGLVRQEERDSDMSTSTRHMQDENHSNMAVAWCVTRTVQVTFTT